MEIGNEALEKDVGEKIVCRRLKHSTPGSDAFQQGTGELGQRSIDIKQQMRLTAVFDDYQSIIAGVDACDGKVVLGI